MKKYYYFVSYRFVDSRGAGFGSDELFLFKEITTMRQIKNMASWIVDNILEKYSYGKVTVVILNYQLLRVEEE